MTRKEEINSFAIDKLLGLGPAFSENEIQYNNGYMRGLIEGAEWADKTLLDKVCKWLEEQVTESDENPYVVIYQFDSIQEMIEDLRKTMEQ